MTTPSNNEQQANAQQMHDIYHTVFLLRQRVVWDVVPAILEFAELYQTITSQQYFGPNRKVSERRAPAKLLLCGPIQSKVRLLRPVRKVAFKIVAHDQGSADDPDAGTWTWFTARHVANDTAEPRNAAQRRGSALAAGEHKEVCRNATAGQQWQVHEVTWRADSSDAEEAAWVSGLVAGDCIDMRAWARFSGWINYIASVSVTVSSVAVVG